MREYDPKDIEPKWQKIWADDPTYARAEDNSSKKNSYILVEFPFPSGAGLHTGHVRSYTALDSLARKRRAQGENVLYPMGWDAFGLPTENYAIKTGRNPKDVTAENVATYKKQMQDLGVSFDWSREINTTDPSYYKWTQWIFLQLFKNGLAYKSKSAINWCPKDKIGLSNEEVVNGCCDRCGTVVEKREREQWMLAITKYAQRLYDDLDTVDFIEAAKAGQRNWISPSKGAEISFEVKSVEGGSSEAVVVFTTRPDTLFGATYLVLAPEHKEISNFKLHITNWDEVERYIEQTKAKSDIERTSVGKEKTGVKLEGVVAINPANKEEIPVFVADYVLGGYGTGAIMAVPAHDERDFEFAKKYNLPVRSVIEPKFIATTGESAIHPDEEFIRREAICAVVRNPKDDTYLCISWKGVHMHGLVTGGLEEGEDMVDAAIREIKEETGYKNLRAVDRAPFALHSLFYHRVKKQNRWARFNYVFLELENEEREVVDEKEESLHEVVWKKKDELKDFFTVIEGEFIVNLLDNPTYIYTDAGILINSGEFDGLESEEAKEKISKHVGGEMKTTYRLRDWIFSRQRYWGEPIPLVHCEKCDWVPVPEDQLPVVLPAVEKYEPTDDGDSPLAQMHDWVNTTCPNCGGPARRETDVMPNWAGSSWYYLRYIDPTNTESLADKKKLKEWLPVEIYNGGMEHTTLHLLYSRFWHKFLYDIGVVPTSEPYMRRVSHGFILGEDGEKMSKSRGNVINPDELIVRFGADTLRMYEMFIGPYDQLVAWSTNGLVGVRRFLERVWKLSEKVGDGGEEPADTKRLLHATIKKVGEDIEGFKFNTAVSSLMILTNSFEELATIPKEWYSSLLSLLAPFAPHMAEELWEMVGNDGRQKDAPWPQFDEKALNEGSVTIAVQVSGKVRGTVQAARGASQEEVYEAAQGMPAVAKWLPENGQVKLIFVPDRILNILPGDLTDNQHSDTLISIYRGTRREI